MKSQGFFLLFLLLQSSLFSGTIKIAVAANVSYAIEDLKKEFYKLHPDTSVSIILGSSGKLTAQINHGAPYHVFMSANMKYPDALYKSKKAVSKPVVYAKGSLALFSVKAQDFSKTLELLKDKKIRKIAVANPKTAPYGIATKEALQNANIYESLKHKFIFGESISQTISYAVSATDIGIVAASSLMSPKMKHYKKGLHWKEIDAKLYTPISQGIVILKEGEKNLEARAFYAFILSAKAKEIFKSYAYSVSGL
ncbi:MAG: molybdate ABC transporter substrate-binding protein [Sulfurimonas sp.]|nr:molybdate ABC transporter substrate-binding protein [Sulfurimonas sp.]MDQ7060994.1 molybdate ABC transporter substrate-binding protein [Sulfurimonas sp.]